MTKAGISPRPFATQCAATWLRGARDVACDSPAICALQGHVRSRCGRDKAGISLNVPRTGGATEGFARSIAGDELQCLRRIVRGRTRLSHRTSRVFSHSPLPGGMGAR
jgi:hypothetical protein